MAGCADDAEQHAVLKEREERSQAEDDAAGEGDKGDGEVVGHDVAGGGGLDADDGLGPHLMTLHGGDHFGTDEVAHELGARGGDDGAEHTESDGDNDRGQHETDLALEDGGIFVAKEEKDGAQIRLSAGIDDMVGASQQLIDVHGVGAGCRVLAQDGEVGGNLAVEQSHLLELGAGKLAEAAGVGLGEQGSEAVPVGPASGDPLVGED